jgi:N-acetylmuramate 1-kinase
MKDARREALQNWARACLQQLTGVDVGDTELEMVSGDASFRRYFRMRLFVDRPSDSLSLNSADSYILVDAPPEHEDCQRFVRIADTFREAGLYAPVVHEVDYYLGFMLLQDFGDTLYLPALLQSQSENDLTRASRLYQQAINAVLELQQNCIGADLPRYDQDLLHKEISLFAQWFCTAFLELALTPSEHVLIERTCDFLEEAALVQPYVCVHRDYHSRNLMVRDGIEDQPPGMVDFQDAVTGPYTYDLVSLLRDCYIVWPDAQVRQWALQYLDQARMRGIIPDSLNEDDFLRDFDLMGLQRHLKVLGIFCRLNLRDGKAQYLQDLPRVIDYVLRIAASYSELIEFTEWFKQRLLPQAMLKLPLTKAPEAVQ